MPPKTDKNILKQYFRSGSRPTQNQFEELIESCYNETCNSFVSGYQLLVDADSKKTVSTLKRQKGRTILIPHFERINTQHERIYHYAIPVSNLSGSYLLDTIILEMNLPENRSYSVMDRRRDVKITQKIHVELIRIYNGSDEIFTVSPDRGRLKEQQEFKAGKSVRQWKGIGIDIVVYYNIESEIAVSDQLDISKQKGDMLEHSFGTAGCIFTPRE